MFFLGLTISGYSKSASLTKGYFLVSPFPLCHTLLVWSTPPINFIHLKVANYGMTKTKICLYIRLLMQTIISKRSEITVFATTYTHSYTQIHVLTIYLNRGEYTAGRIV